MIQAELGSQCEFIAVTTTLDEFNQTIERAKSAGVNSIYIGGGDGSVRLAAKELVGTKIVMRILPLGTGNSLARELGIPIPVEEAIHFHTFQAQDFAIDVGKFDGNTFVNVATTGLTTQIVRELDPDAKKKLGRLAYLGAVTRALSSTRSFHIEVQSPDGNYKGRAIQFVAASTRYHAGPFPVTQDAAIDSGKLAIYVVTKGNQVALLKYGFGLLTGRHEELPNVWTIDTTQAKLRLHHRRKFILDGDEVNAMDPTIEVVPRALWVSGDPDKAPRF